MATAVWVGWVAWTCNTPCAYYITATQAIPPDRRGGRTEGNRKVSLRNLPSSGDLSIADGRRPEPGGWNRISLDVADLEAAVDELKEQGVTFRSEIIRGVGGDQVLVEDPSGNCIELFHQH